MVRKPPVSRHTERVAGRCVAEKRFGRRFAAKKEFAGRRHERQSHERMFPAQATAFVSRNYSPSLALSSQDSLNANAWIFCVGNIQRSTHSHNSLSKTPS